MRISTPFRTMLIPAFVASTLVGCSSGGTTQDATPTAPPITKENIKAATDEVSAGAKGMVTPGVTPPPKR